MDFRVELLWRPMRHNSTNRKVPMVLWKNLDDHHRYHLVGWKTVCKSFHADSIRIHSRRKVNFA